MKSRQRKKQEHKVKVKQKSVPENKSRQGLILNGELLFANRVDFDLDDINKL